MTPPGCAPWSRRQCPTSCRRWLRRCRQALPGILSLTNKIAAVLDNAANATSNLNSTIVAAQPLVTNFAGISGAIARARRADALGAGHQFAFHRLQAALTNANALLVNTDTNLNH